MNDRRTEGRRARISGCPAPYGARAVAGALSGVIATALLLAVPPTVEAQWAKFSRLGREQGLSQTAVYALAQDREGFLWVGTQNGLDRYDGRTFRSDWVGDEGPSPVSFGLVRTLLVDTAGELWAGMDAHGLFRYDRMTERFHPVPARSDDGRSLDTLLTVFDMAESDGALVLATSQGLGRVERVSGSPVLRLERAPSGGACGDEVWAVWVAPDGALWVGTDRGCVRVLPKAGSSERTVSLGIGRGVGDIAPGRGDTVWVGSEAGLFVLDSSGVLLASPAELETLGSRAFVRSAYRDSHGDVWVGTNGGLGFFPSVGPAVAWYGASDPVQGGLPNDLVLSLLEDASGGMWVGTWDGLARLGPLHRALWFIPSAAIVPDMGGVVALAAWGSRSILAGGMEGVVASLPDLEGTAGSVVAGLEQEMGFVVSLATSGDTIWAATVGRGMHRRGPRGWRAYRRGATGDGNAPSDQFAAVAVDRSGAVWAGTVSSGLTVYDPRADRFTPFRGPRGDFVYAADYIWPIVEDRTGALWFGANGQNGGIHRLSGDRTELSTWRTGGDPERPNAGRVTTLEPSGDSVVWFGTQGAGLGRLDVATGSTRFYTTEDGLPHNTVAGILQGARGYLWISTEWGLARFDPRAERFWVLGEEAGLQSNRFYFNATLRADDGRLYFGGPNGVNVIDPSSLSPPEHPPPLAITRFSVRGRVRPDVNNLTAKTGLSLAPGENFFTLEMSALDFADVTLDEYRYRLDPLDDGWVSNGSSPVANYTSVPPDAYVFRAQVRRHGGDWIGEGLSIPILVRPFFYQTLWFQSAVVLAVLGFISGLYAYRLRELHRRQELRLSIAGELHDDIGADLSTIATKAGMVRMAAELDDRSRSHLQDVVRLAVDSAHRVRETIWAVNTRYDTLPALVSRMRDTADEILGGHVAYTVDEPTSVPAVKLSMETRQHIYLMFKESLHNVTKHALASRVRIQLRLKPGEIAFTVEDDGAGFCPDEAGDGSGLALLRHRAARCHGTFRITSRPGGGTKVEVRARLG